MTDVNVLKTTIDAIYDEGREPESGPVRDAIALLDSGTLRVAEPPADGADGDWTVNGWLKKAILLYFRIQAMEQLEAGPMEYHDKLPLKSGFEGKGVRVVPPAVARYGSFLAPGTILMPSYVNIGAYVGKGTLVDTWATVGSCAQVGENVHLSGGVGLGGVLEPVQGRPVVIEDGAFIGSRCVVVEGVRVGREAVLAAGVVLTSSVPIIDVTGEEPVEHRGVVPPRAVVVPGTRPKTFSAGEYALPCGLIIGYRTESTDGRLELEDTLREFGIEGA